MVFFKRVGKVGGHIVNLKAHEWLGLSYIKESILSNLNSTKSLFSPTQANRTETFEEALDLFFKCPSCGQVLNLKKNDKIRKLFLKKIDQIKQDVKA